jgi:hypothetical protein
VLFPHVGLRRLGGEGSRSVKGTSSLPTQMNSPRKNLSFGQKSRAFSPGNYTVYRNAASHLHRPTYHHLQTETLTTGYEGFFLLINRCITKLTRHHHTTLIEATTARSFIPLPRTSTLPCAKCRNCGFANRGLKLVGPVEQATTDEAQPEAHIQHEVNGKAGTGNIIQALGGGGVHS